MKLRNKKTGKIWHMPRLRQPTIQEDDISFFACIGEHGCSRGELFSYKSLAELNADWEDVEPAEPLIRDEKIRKVFREWADLIGAERFRVNHFRNAKTTILTSTDLITEPSIELPGHIGKDSEIYTITELCGEEEYSSARQLAENICEVMDKERRKNERNKV